MAIQETNPRLGIPRSPASMTYGVIARTILAHPHIKRLAKTYNVPGVEGKFQLAEAMLTPNWTPMASQSPSLWIWPEPQDGQVGTNANQNARLFVNIRWYVLSPDPLDAMDLWGLVEQAVNPATPELGAELAAELGRASKWGQILIHEPGSVSLETDAGLVTALTGAVSTGYRIQGFGG